MDERDRKVNLRVKEEERGERRNGREKNGGRKGEYKGGKEGKE